MLDIPKCPIPPEYWPNKVKYAAMDYDGKWHYYTYKPKLTEEYWDCNFRTCFAVMPPSPNWNKTLTKR
jgi:hypothetical protein